MRNYYLNGIIAISIVAFIQSVGQFVILELMGRLETLVIRKVLRHEIFSNSYCPAAFVMVIIITGRFDTPYPTFSSLR